MTLSKQVQRAFMQHFGRQPDGVVRAPGRVNLIGEHTDYNDGFVLPCAINYETSVAFAKRADDTIRVLALDYENQRDEFLLAEMISHHPDQRWSDYVRGVVKCLQDAGYLLHGLDLLVSGNVPQGAGLSSSASLEVAITQAFKTAFGLDISSVEMARISQQAENQFIGCQCGIMDQMVSACGLRNHALLLDCRNLQSALIPVPADWAVLIVHSRIERGLVDSEYNLRRAQCEAAARHYGVPALRDLSLELLEADKAGLDETTFRRARHIVGENSRTLAAANALAAGDLAALGRLMAGSHAAMRDDFAITTPEIDALVEMLAAAMGSEGGARMTGGGFGGCVVAILRPDDLENVIATVKDQYARQFGLEAQFYICHADDGAGVAV